MGIQFSLNKVKKGKIIFRYPYELVKILDGGNYQIKFSIGLKNYNIKRGDISKVHQDLLKKTSIFIYDNLSKLLLNNIDLTEIVVDCDAISADQSFNSDSSDMQSN